MPTQGKHSSLYTKCGTKQLTGLQTHENPTPPESISSSTCKLINSKKSLTCKHTNSSNQKFKLLFQFYNSALIFTPFLEKIQAIKQVICHYFQSFASSNMFVFKKKGCILHHLAFLVWLPVHCYLYPITYFLPLNPHFLTTILPFLPCLSWFLKVLFIPLQCIFILFVLRLAAFCTAFCTILPCVQHQNALHLTAKRTAFSGKTHFVQRHIALRFGANCSTFSRKQLQVWCKWRPFQIKIHFTAFTS